MTEGYPIDSKEGREAFTRGGWDNIPEADWLEALEALKKYKIPDRFLQSKSKKKRTPEEKRSAPTSQPQPSPTPMVAKPYNSQSLDRKDTK